MKTPERENGLDSQLQNHGDGIVKPKVGYQGVPEDWPKIFNVEDKPLEIADLSVLLELGEESVGLLIDAVVDVGSKLDQERQSYEQVGEEPNQINLVVPHGDLDEKHPELQVHDDDVEDKRACRDQGVDTALIIAT